MNRKQVVVCVVGGLICLGLVTWSQISERHSVGQLSVVVDGDTPISRILIGGERSAVIAKFRFFAKGEPFLVKQLRIRNSDGQSNPCVEAVRISFPRQDGKQEEKVGVLGEKVLSAADFSNLNFFVPENKPAILTVSVDLWRIVAAGCSGSKITASLAFDFFEAIGQKSNERLAAHGDKKDDYFGSAASINAFPMTIRKTKPTVTLAAGSPSGADVPKTNQEVLRFTVAAGAGGDLEVNEIHFFLIASDQGANYWNSGDNLTGKLALYEREDMAAPLAGSWMFTESVINLNEPIFINFIFHPNKTISAGTSKTFSLVIDTSGAARSSSKGDGDKIRVEIPKMGIVWSETGIGAVKEIDGANVQRLPVAGGIISY